MKLTYYILFACLIAGTYAQQNTLQRNQGGQKPGHVRSSGTPCFNNLKADSVLIAQGVNDHMEAVDTHPGSKKKWLNKNLWNPSASSYSVSCAAKGTPQTHLCHLLKTADCSGSVPENVFTITGGADKKGNLNKYTVMMHQRHPNSAFSFSVTDNKGKKIKVTIQNNIRRRLLQDGDAGS